MNNRILCFLTRWLTSRKEQTGCGAATPLARRDVARNLRGADDPAVMGADRRDRQRNRDQRAIPCAGGSSRRSRTDSPSLIRAMILASFAVMAFRGQQSGWVFRSPPLAAKPNRRSAAGFPAGDDPVQILADNGVERRFHDRREPRIGIRVAGSIGKIEWVNVSPASFPPIIAALGSQRQQPNPAGDVPKSRVRRRFGGPSSRQQIAMDHVQAGKTAPSPSAQRLMPVSHIDWEQTSAVAVSHIEKIGSCQPDMATWGTGLGFFSGFPPGLWERLPPLPRPAWSSRSRRNPALRGSNRSGPTFPRCAMMPAKLNLGPVNDRRGGEKTGCPD